jgi:hypothetical protein
MKKVKFYIACIALLGFSLTSESFGQSMQGAPFYEGLFSPSPDVAATATYGIVPVALYTGTPQVSFPIYTVKAGSLTVPVSLDYNYNGLRPKEDASWVGLGWNLSAGGVITRIVQGQVDGSKSSGYNYDQYSLIDSLNSQTWLQNAASGNYDLAPDIFVFDFPGHGGKFVYYQGSGYAMPYQKLNIVKASNDSYFQITDENDVSYLFNITEKTSPPTKQKYPGDPIVPAFISSWHLTQMVSANKKDTITFTYSSPYTYTEYGSPYGEVDWQHIVGSTPVDSINFEFWMPPNISTEVLSSIDCNHTRINFVTSTGRLDAYNPYPELDEIIVTDKITGNNIKQYNFAYAYFNNPGINDWGTHRLKLTTFKESATFTGADDQLTGSHNYNFYYKSDTANFPKKSTYGIDNWGFYNGKDGNVNILPVSVIGSATGAIRDPNFTYASYGALDSIVYPTGGSTSFQYELNTYLGTTPGPGIRVKTVSAYVNGSTSPSVVKSYSYSNGNLFNAGSELSSYTYNNNIYGVTYTVYTAGVCSAFGGIMDNTFYYGNVTETVSSGNEIHRTDYVFSSSVAYSSGMDMIQKTDYSYIPFTGYQTISQLNNSVAYQTTGKGRTFNTGSVVQTALPVINTPSLSSIFCTWKYPTQQSATYYDKQGNASITTTQFYYNNSTANLLETSTNNSDGSYTLNKFKYPEDYTTSITGGLINKHVLSPVIEQQLWRKNSGTDSVILSGKILSIDTTLIRATDEYYLEISSPMHTLSNETQTGGLYNTLVSDANYVDRVQHQYDANANLSQQNLSNNISETYLYAYGHHYAIAKVTNAMSTQVAYTSFETTDKGNWSYSGATSAGGKTGDYQYSLSGGSITSPTLSSGTYVVSYWSASSAASVSSTGTVTTKVNGEADGSGWSYYEYQVTLSSSGTMTISGTVSIDELRLYPSNAQMSTMTYHPGIGITSECSSSNKISYYLYDGYNRLYEVTDQQKNILRTVQYNLVNSTQVVQ